MTLIERSCSSLLVGSLLVLLKLSAITTAAQTNRFQTGQKVKVEIDNMLPGPATVHCKSKDNDLGPHTIGPNQNYSFVFNVNFFGTTLFFCTVTTSDGKRASFNAFKASRDENRCSHFCPWHLNTDGVEGFRTGPKPDIVIPWQ